MVKLLKSGDYPAWCAVGVANAERKNRALEPLSGQGLEVDEIFYHWNIFFFNPKPPLPFLSLTFLSLFLSLLDFSFSREFFLSFVNVSSVFSFFR